jgi:hypothetical protein
LAAAGAELDDALAAERAFVGVVAHVQAEPVHGRLAGYKVRVGD